MDIIWETNPDWQQLESPAEGDIVHLKCANGFGYLVKIIVSAMDEDNIFGLVDAVFDWDSRQQITGGDILNIVGKKFAFRKYSIQRVIKKLKPTH